jgi:hypothetical protein
MRQLEALIAGEAHEAVGHGGNMKGTRERGNEGRAGR